MSWQKAYAVWALNLPPVSKFVLMALATREGEKGCFPSQETLHQMTRYSESSIRRAIRQLEKAGHLKVHRQRDRSNEYTVIINPTETAVNALHKMIQNGTGGTGQSDRTPSGQSDRMMRSNGPKGPVTVTGYISIRKKISGTEAEAPPEARQIGTYAEYLKKLQESPGADPSPTAPESGQEPPKLPSPTAPEAPESGLASKVTRSRQSPSTAQAPPPP